MMYIPLFERNGALLKMQRAIVNCVPDQSLYFWMKRIIIEATSQRFAE